MIRLPRSFVQLCHLTTNENKAYCNNFSSGFHCARKSAAEVGLNLASYDFTPKRYN